MTVNTGNVLTGVATLYYAPNVAGVPEPQVSDSLAFGVPWTGNWVSPGATDTGVTWSVDAKTIDINVEEQSNPVLVPIDTSDFMIGCTLMEDVIKNMLLAYGRGSIAITAGTAGRTDSACTTTLGSSIVLDAAAVSGDVGKKVVGTNVPSGGFVISVVAGTSFRMNVDATASGSSLTEVVGGTNVKSTLTLAEVLNQYSFGFEGINTQGLARRVYMPLGVVSGTKVDTVYQRAKAARKYATSFRALCPPASIQIVDYGTYS